MKRVYLKSLRDVRTKYNVSPLMGSWIKKKKKSQQPAIDILGNNWGLGSRAPPAFSRVLSLLSSLPFSLQSSSTDRPSPDTLAHSAFPLPWLLHLTSTELFLHTFPQLEACLGADGYCLVWTHGCQWKLFRGHGSWLLCRPQPMHSRNNCAIELGKGIQIQIYCDHDDGDGDDC